MELQVAVEENRIVRKIPIMCVTAEAAKVYSRSRMSEVWSSWIFNVFYFSVNSLTTRQTYAWQSLLAEPF